MVQVIHAAVKGRVRYKVDGLYRSESLKLRLEQGLAGREGILGVSVNMLTGTVLVLYDSGNGHNAWSLATILEGVTNAHRPQAAVAIPRTAGENDRTQALIAGKESSPANLRVPQGRLENTEQLKSSRTYAKFANRSSMPRNSRMRRGIA